MTANDFFEVDLAGELQPECCEHEQDQMECNCGCHEQDWDGDSEADRCLRPTLGELATASARIVRFPSRVGGWEPDPPSAPAACALCLEDGADASGLCRICERRLPRTGGCGLAVGLVASLTGWDGDTRGALDHLTACRDCRDFFGQVGELARAADQEADLSAHPATAAALMAA